MPPEPPTRPPTPDPPKALGRGPSRTPKQFPIEPRTPPNRRSHRVPQISREALPDFTGSPSSKFENPNPKTKSGQENVYGKRTKKRVRKTYTVSQNASPLAFCATVYVFRTRFLVRFPYTIFCPLLFLGFHFSENGKRKTVKRETENGQDFFQKWTNRVYGIRTRFVYGIRTQFRVRKTVTRPPQAHPEPPYLGRSGARTKALKRKHQKSAHKNQH